MSGARSRHVPSSAAHPSNPYLGSALAGSKLVPSPWAAGDDHDFEYVVINSTIVRARQHAAAKRGPEARAIGRSRGGVRIALGNPLRPS
ncbi:hypothetical protein SAMN05444161_8291 [Rhizobiales bacterium GAS191]|jgi:hypothetical protein|nr:hypothetical protein SAMN05444161_8291 [Rhizobiales bacterium GAS191]